MWTKLIFTFAVLDFIVIGVKILGAVARAYQALTTRWAG